MQIHKFSDMKGGWFVGDFVPTAYRTKDFEVSFKKHRKTEKCDYHYHTKVVEINLLISGKMTMQGKELNGGDIFILQPFEIADPIFIEDCDIICVKTPSAQDKICFDFKA